MSSETINNLGQLGRDLAASIDGLETLEFAAVEAEGAYKVAKAKAYLNAEGSVQAREAIATVATENERAASEVCVAAVRVQRERIRALHARIDIGRSLLTTERQLAGVST